MASDEGKLVLNHFALHQNNHTRMPGLDVSTLITGVLLLETHDRVLSPSTEDASLRVTSAIGLAHPHGRLSSSLELNGVGQVHLLNSK